MTGTRCLNLLQVIVLYVSTRETMGSPLPSNQDFHAGYAEVNSDNSEKNVHASVFGQHSRVGNSEYEQQILFANPGVETGVDNSGNWRSYPNAYVHTGVYRMTGNTKDHFGENTAGSNYAIDFLTAGAEVGRGVMGRARLTDATVSVGPGELNLGVGLDTGIIVKDGFEAKFAGIGGGISSKGIHGCFILCIGFNWG